MQDQLDANMENHTVEAYVGTDGLRQDEFYKGFKGILITDGLAQYHLMTGLTPDICLNPRR